MNKCRYCNSSSYGSGCPHSPTITTPFYTDYEGIYRLRGARYRRDTLHYDPARVESTLDGVLGHLVRQGDRLRLLGTHHAFIDVWAAHGGEIQSPYAGLLVFD